MSRELIFLVSAKPVQVAEIESGALCQMKVPPTCGANPLVAFASVDLGHQHIADCNIENWAALREVSGLTPDQVKDARTKGVFLFEQQEHLTQYLEQGENFDFARRIFSFEEAERRVKNAL